MEEWLAANYPDRAARVMSLVRQMRGGKAYDARWGLRQRGEGPIARLIAARFRRACEKLGLNRALGPLDASQFRPPPRNPNQLELFL